MKLQKLIAFIVLGLAVLTLAACSSSPTKSQYASTPAKYIYAKGHKYLQGKDYSNAITAFQALDSEYPFGIYAQKGDSELIYALYKNGDPALALAAADRYIMLYPKNKHAAYAYYMRGVIEYNDGRGFLQKYFPYSMAKHNSKNYVLAYNDFNRVVTDYPTSLYAKDARRRMVYLKNVMAQYQLNVAEFYFKLKAYVAAIARAKIVLQHYPRTEAVKPALTLVVKSYKQLGLPKLAADYQAIINTNHNKT